MNQFVFPPGLKPQISSFHRRKILLLPSGPNLRFTKHVSLHFQNCEKRLLGHIVPFHGKRCHWRVFSECLLPEKMLLWLSEIVLLDYIPERSGKQLIASRKLINVSKFVVVMKSKMNQCVFLAGLRLQLSRFHSGKFLLPSGHHSQVQNTCFPSLSELCKDTPRTQCYLHSIRKELRRECSVSVDSHSCCYPN